MFKYYLFSAVIGWVVSFVLTSSVFGEHANWSPEANRVFILFVFVIVFLLCSCVGLHKRVKKVIENDALIINNLESEIEEIRKSNPVSKEIMQEKDERIEQLSDLIKLLTEKT